MTMNTKTMAMAALLVLASCGSTADDTASSPDSLPPVTLDATVTTAPAADATRNDAAYLDALRGLDSSLVEDEQKALNRGGNICLDIAQGKDQATLIKNAGARFDVDADMATLIYQAAHAHLCGDLAVTQLQVGG